jgi:hypothetical protein
MRAFFQKELLKLKNQEPYNFEDLVEIFAEKNELIYISKSYTLKDACADIIRDDLDDFDDLDKLRKEFGLMKISNKKDDWNFVKYDGKYKLTILSTNELIDEIIDTVNPKIFRTFFKEQYDN